MNSAQQDHESRNRYPPILVREGMAIPEVDPLVLDRLYRSDLRSLRENAEHEGVSKRGSVEVLRASLIRHHVLSDLDLSWEGIQSFSNRELGDLLRIFGVKASGSHKERRQRIWLHVTQDANRLTVESLATMERQKLVDLCRNLEIPSNGPRTVLMGHVAGVLASQRKAWGHIKRSLRRNGLLGDPKLETTKVRRSGSESKIGVRVPDVASLEDVSDLLSRALENTEPQDSRVLQNLSSDPEKFGRMVGTVGLVRGPKWDRSSTDLLISIMSVRGLKISSERARRDLHLAASRIAECWIGESDEMLEGIDVESLRYRFDNRGIEELASAIMRSRSE